jgi:hypothetical protein
MRLIASLLLMMLSIAVHAQKVSGKLIFQSGQVLNVTIKNTSNNLINIMGREIELKTESTVDQVYRVTNTTDENHTLSRENKRIRMKSEGMTGELDFDSDSEKDMKGQFGAPVKQVLAKKINMVIDASGNTLMAVSEGAVSKSTTAGTEMLAQLLGELSDLTEAPKQGAASFFKVLPANEVGKGDGWTNTVELNGSKTEEAFSIADINDDHIILNYLANATSSREQETMGRQVTINVKNKTEGKITVDRKTGIIKEKNLNTTVSGTVATEMGELPINGTSSTVVSVN